MLELGAPMIKDIIELDSFFNPGVNLKLDPYEFSACLGIYKINKCLYKRNLLSKCWCLIFECMAAGAYEYWRADK